MSGNIIGINPCINGLNYHDPSCALIKDNKLICAIEEERFNFIKNSPGLFPEKSIQTCLLKGGIHFDDIDIISIPYNIKYTTQRDKIIADYYIKYVNDREELLNFIVNFKTNNITTENHIRAIILDKIKFKRKLPQILFFDHHLCHAASAVFCTDLNDAMIIVADGIGEIDATSIYFFHDNKFEKIVSIPFPNSLGYFYAAITAFLGFTPWEQEGKTMALAGYGKYNNDIYGKFDNVIKNMEMYDVSRLFEDCIKDGLMLNIDKICMKLEMILNKKKREQNEDLNSYYEDIAFYAQDFIEKSIINLITNHISKIKTGNICASGGLFLNCKMNLQIREKFAEYNYFVQPVAKDSGLSLGAALLANPERIRINDYSLGLGYIYDTHETEKLLVKSGIEYTKTDNITHTISDMLLEGFIGCWFENGAEFGPRALGNRSIIADCRFKETADFINLHIKHREKWRPFAISILEDFAHLVLEGFKINDKSRYMIQSYRVKKEWREKIKAGLHANDWTTRPHTVHAEAQPKYYSIISSFYKKTGVPAILNTSLNDKGKPLIEQPIDAIRFFFSSPCAFLVINNILIKKNKPIKWSDNYE